MRVVSRIGWRHVAVVAVVWLLCVAYLAPRANRGWIPHDEGLLGQSAERVLHGELPHRDFDDTYTGGLAILHAAAFRVFGVRLAALRLVLLLFSAAFIPVVYWVASRVTTPAIAGLVTATCVAWSVPNYFAGLPSWYNLFFATFGTAALLRHIETGRDRWLFVAGACGGLAILIKTIGLYYVGAVLLYLLYREQTTGPSPPMNSPDARPRPGALSLVAIAGLIAFVAATSVLVSYFGGLMAVVEFVLPPAALCAFLASSELRSPHPHAAARLRTFGRLLLPFGAGVALPCVAFLAPYAATGDVGRLLYGVFVLPQQRFEFAVFSLPAPWTLLATAPLALLLVAPLLRPAGPPRLCASWTLLVAVGLLLGVAVVAGREEHVYRAVWYSARPAVVIAVLAGTAALVSGSELSVERRLRLFLLLAMAALMNLVQFPYAFGIYFCYTAPLIVLAILYVVASEAWAPRRLHLCLLGFYLAFALVWLNRGFIRDIGGRFTYLEQRTPLDAERGGLLVSAPEADLYQRLVATIQAHSSDGDFIYATPDCPQVYFLANRRNPTRTFYDFFDSDYGADTGPRRQRILALLESRRVPVIVIHWQPEFSRTYDPELMAVLVQRFPNRASVDLDAYPGPAKFSVRWRELPGP